jgi:hypothetical protein
MFRVPAWAMSMAASHHLRQHDVLWRYKEHPQWHQVMQAFDYVVLNLRKCTNGLPLIPKTATFAEVPASDPSNEWEPAVLIDFTLAAYLRAFLERLGLPGGEHFHDSLDGRLLVPYQAAVPRAVWAELWASLTRAFRTQRAAYRRLVGGRCAPEVSEGASPRFLSPDKVTAGLSKRSSSPQSKSIPVQRTFVHFAPQGLRDRCGSGASVLEDVYDPPYSALIC